MKKVKYLIGIIIIFILFFIGIEIFKKQEIDQNTMNSTNNIKETNNNINTSTTNETNTKNENINKPEINKPIITEISSGKELLEKADKTLTARGWAGASNNVIGIKDNIMYYYNISTGELKKIATGIEDIYYKTEFSEEIIAIKGKDAEIIDSKELTFLIFE